MGDSDDKAKVIDETYAQPPSSFISSFNPIPSGVQIQSPYQTFGGDAQDLSGVSGPEFLFPSSAQKQRSFGEMACYATGSAYLIGQGIGGTWGSFEGLRHPAATTNRLRVNTVLNAVTKRGPALGNALGILALMYSGVNYAAVTIRGGQDDVINQVAAGAVTGLIFKSTAGPRTTVLATATGAGVIAAYHFVNKFLFDTGSSSAPTAAPVQEKQYS